MVLKVLRHAAVCAVLSFPAWAGDATAFVSVIDDLPLMAGLSEAGQGVAFTTSQGRIAEATASGGVTRAAVLAFYAKTLPQLGWQRAGDTRFTREGETLDLLFTTSGGSLSVRFSLAPTGK